MSSVFFTADTHFNHVNILKYCPPRGQAWSSVNEMNEGIINNWNSVVPENGTVYHLGDFGFGNPDSIVPILERLNGNITLIVGNHDRQICRNLDIFRPLFDRIISKKRFYEDFDGIRISMSHKPSLRDINCLSLWGHSHGSSLPAFDSVDVGIDSPWILGFPVHRPFSLTEVLDWRSRYNNRPGL